MHLAKYFIKFNYLNQNRTQYIKARSKQEAFIKLLKKHKVDSISSLSIEGDPLPTRQETATKIIKQSEATKRKIRQGRIKYYQLHDKTVFDK